MLISTNKENEGSDHMYGDTTIIYDNNMTTVLFLLI